MCDQCGRSMCNEVLEDLCDHCLRTEIRRREAEDVDFDAWLDEEAAIGQRYYPPACVELQAKEQPK
jgi:hypothetical protein